jgi:hypothetical protein
LAHHEYWIYLKVQRIQHILRPRPTLHQPSLYNSEMEIGLFRKEAHKALER